MLSANTSHVDCSLRFSLEWLLMRMSRCLWNLGDGPTVVAGDVIVRLGCDR